MPRKLDREAVRIVDSAVAAAIRQSPSRVLTIAEAKIVEADTAAHDAEVSEARRRRGVWVGGTRDDAEGAGLRTVYARVASADAVWVDATVDRVADLLAADEDLRKHHPDLPEEPTKDELRAVALGWLARPHDLAELLGVIEEQTPAERTRRRGRAVVYVHLHESALLGAEAVARAEAIGPVLTTHLAELLRHCNIELKPVIDLNAGASVNCYEHPAAVKERTHLPGGRRRLPVLHLDEPAG